MNSRRLFPLLLMVSCGAFLEPPPPNPGRACSQDADCVPNGCCGTAGSATHTLDAPSCAGVTCSGMCPAAQVSCGCGVPICRDARCTVAVATSMGCE